jgi:o-succinylbenzoate synthase
MKLRDVAWMPFRLPYVTPFATAHGVEEFREGLLLQLTTDDGLEGLGEAAPVTAFGDGTLADTLAVIGRLAPHLIGLELDAAEALLSTLDIVQPGVAAAACGLDTALCDLRARAAGIPIASLLGSNAIQSLLVNATVGTADTAGAVAAATRAAAAGFQCVKLKVGVSATPQEEIARIAAVRDALGDGIRLRLDANGAWDEADAVAILRAVEPYNIELVEQPVGADNIAGMARVRAAVSTLIAADESVRGQVDARHVIAAGAADVLIVKPMLAGGLRPAQEIIRVAAEAGLSVVVTTTIDSGVGNTAALHLAATLPQPARACGLATGPLLTGSLVTQAPSVHNSRMAVPHGAGIGVILDPEQLRHFGDGWRTVEA